MLNCNNTWCLSQPTCYTGPQGTTTDHDRPKKTVAKRNGWFTTLVYMKQLIAMELLQKSKAENPPYTQANATPSTDIHKIKFEYP